jgi:hypothetical protein
MLAQRTAMSVPESLVRSLEDPTLAPETQAVVELPRPLLKHLRPLGHEILLWQSAARQLLAWMDKGRFEAELGTFLQRWKPRTEPSSMTAEGPFTLLLHEHPEGWRLTQSSLGWVNDPAWAAFLHLPALRPSWSALLRASHLEHLRQMIPQAWLLDDMPLPPGSVIAGLEIPGWSGLPDIGKRFRLHQTGRELTVQLPAQEWKAAIEQSLATGQEILVTPPPEDAACLLARFTRDKDGTRLESAWTADASGRACLARDL